MNSKELRKLILEGAEPVVREFIELAVNPPANDVKTQDRANARRSLIAFALEAAQDAKDLQKLEMESTQDVLKLIAEGVVTVEEGMQLMQVMKAKQDIEELPKLVAALQGEK